MQQQAVESIINANEEGFNNITIDFIYGHSGLKRYQWKKNIEKAIEFGVPHISCYALTVEPKTALAKNDKAKRIKDVNQSEHRQDNFCC